MVVKSHKGLHDWIVQRATAILIGIYTLFIIIYLLTAVPLGYTRWHQLFNNVGMQIASCIVLLAIVWHAWLGLWTVLTDYIKNGALRLVLQSLVILILLGYLFWGLKILF